MRSCTPRKSGQANGQTLTCWNMQSSWQMDEESPLRRWACDPWVQRAGRGTRRSGGAGAELVRETLSTDYSRDAAHCTYIVLCALERLDLQDRCDLVGGVPAMVDVFSVFYTGQQQCDLVDCTHRADTHLSMEENTKFTNSSRA